MDKAVSPHYRSRKVRDCFDRHKDTLIPVYLPTASPEFMILEEVWNIAKRDLLVLKHYPSFEDFICKVSCYFRTKRFNLEYEELSVKDGLRTYVKWYTQSKIMPTNVQKIQG